MKKTVILLAALLTGASLAADTAPASSYSITADFPYTTKYVFRGVQYAEGAFQPSVKFTQGDFYAGVWMSAPVEAPLRHRFAEVRVENDCISALEAERRWGALQGFEHCAYVTWSTGIGMGLCVDGRILRGKNGNAGHGGHMFVVDNDDALCGCGNVGDLEALVAGNAIARRFGADAASLLRQARAGDTQAVEGPDRDHERLGERLETAAEDQQDRHRRGQQDGHVRRAEARMDARDRPEEQPVFGHREEEAR